MKKVTKTIKLFNSLSEEERSEFLDFFKEDVEEETKKEEPKEEKKEEPKKEEPEKKVEKEVEKKGTDFEALFKQFTTQYQEEIGALVKEVKTLKEQKAETIGIKAKPKEPKDENSFDSVFARLQK
jgi:hypothetical protein